MAIKYKRALIKIRGEALAGKDGFGINSEEVAKVVSQIKTVVSQGVQIGIVVGGGNFWRGRNRESELNIHTMDRSCKVFL